MDSTVLTSNEEIEMARYAITNAYDIKDSIKAAGATWDGERKAWIVTQTTLDKLNARTHSYGMCWMRGWSKAKVEAVEE